MERLNGVASQRVKEQTGKGWAEWIDWLDAKGAANLDHRAIADLVYAQTQKGWWSQNVTVGYEQAKGRRVRNQAPDGFQVSVSKTYDFPLPKVFRAWDVELSKWYNGSDFSITTNNTNKNLRGKLADGGTLEVAFYTTKTGKTQVVMAVTKLGSVTASEQARRVCRQQLDQLADFLK
jgi:hypothetical protein